MELNDYQRKAMTTALPAALSKEYMFLNLASEAGEVAGLLAKAGRDGWDVDDLRAKAVLELGDVLWQVAGCCEVLGLSLSDVAQANLDKLASRKERGKISGSGDQR